MSVQSTVCVFSCFISGSFCVYYIHVNHLEPKSSGVLVSVQEGKDWFKVIRHVVTCRMGSQFGLDVNK